MTVSTKTIEKIRRKYLGFHVLCPTKVREQRFDTSHDLNHQICSYTINIIPLLDKVDLNLHIPHIIKHQYIMQH